MLQKVKTTAVERLSWVKDLNSKMKTWERIVFVVFFIAVTIFTIFDPGHALGGNSATIAVAAAKAGHGAIAGEYFSHISWLAGGFKPDATSAQLAGQILEVIGIPLAVMATINRMYRFKQELMFSLVSNFFTGMGLILNGIGTDGILIVIQGFIMISAWPIWHISARGNQRKVESKFDLKHILIAAGIFTVLYAVLTIAYAYIGNPFLGDYNGYQGSFSAFSHWQLYYDVLVASLIMTGIAMMTIFKWSYGFILLFVSNILALFIYSGMTNNAQIVHGAAHNTSWGMFILMFFYTYITIHQFIRWNLSNKVAK